MKSILKVFSNLNDSTTKTILKSNLLSLALSVTQYWSLLLLSFHSPLQQRLLKIPWTLMFYLKTLLPPQYQRQRNLATFYYSTQTICTFKSPVWREETNKRNRKRGTISYEYLHTNFQISSIELKFYSAYYQ